VHRLAKNISYVTAVVLLAVGVLVLDEMGLLGGSPEDPAHSVSGALARMGSRVRQKTLEQRRLYSYRKYMDKVVSRDAELEKVANHLVRRRCEQGDKACEAFHITRFVASEIRYQPDGRGAGDYVRPWRQTYESRGGDCEDQAILLASMLEAVGSKTLMFFTKDHVHPGVCLSERVTDTRYLDDDATYWELRVEGEDLFCYPLEPTIEDSRLGHPPDPCIQAVYDPLSEARYHLVMDGECT
jgi:hypothetical protein